MYLFAKILQAAGLAVIGIGFITAFPELINMKILLGGTIFFGGGYLTERLLLRSK
ncbi:MAG: hypothetical protein WC676_05590 [Candidatus Omnitrophota bacterium]